jgi:hypothetical protein
VPGRSILGVLSEFNKEKVVMIEGLEGVQIQSQTRPAFLSLQKGFCKRKKGWHSG